MKMPLLNGQVYYMERRLYENLLELVKLNNKDYDSLILVTGAVGSGKSTLGVQVHTAINPGFNLDNLSFNGEDFEDKVVNKLRNFDGVQVDEAVDGMNAKEHYRQINIRIEKLLAKMRLKNLYITACMPRLKDFSEFTIHRASLWLKCFTIKKERGFFVGFSPKRLQQTYYGEKAKKSMKRLRYNFRGRFFDGLCNIGKEEYKIAKSQAFIDYYNKTGRKLTKTPDHMDIAIKLKQKGFGPAEISRILNKPDSTVSDWLRKQPGSLEKTDF